MENGKTSFEAAVDHARRLQSEAEASCSPAAGSLLLEHGFRTPVAVAWLHGYTNCPRQFELLGRMCYDRGWNVWIPRAPHHGLTDRSGDATSLLRVAQLESWGNSAVDICRGLGEKVVVGGLSMGGTVAASVGLRRPEISLALSIAPFLSPLPGPPILTRLAITAVLALPDRMAWWDPDAKESLAGPEHVYYRYSMKGLARIVRLGFRFAAGARRSAPAAGRIVFVLNDGDEYLRSTLVDAVLRRWRNRGITNAGAVHLGKELGLRHDLIDPQQPYANTDVAYPILLREIARGLAGDAAATP